jgi:hypothetical protein
MIPKSLALPMIKEVSEGYDIDKVYADKAHDNRRSFNLLDNLNIEPAIQIRKNASIKTKGCPLRRDEVLLIKKLGYERCKQLKDMGRRWMDCRDCLFIIKKNTR